MCSLSRDFFTVLALLVQKQLFDFYFTHFLFPGMFSLCWPSQSTQCLRVLPLDWRLQAAMSGQCLLPSLPTSTSFVRLSHSQLYQFLKIHHFSSSDPKFLHILISSHFNHSPFSRFVITFCVSLELLQAGTSTVGFSLALITFSLVRWASQF